MPEPVKLWARARWVHHITFGDCVVTQVATLLSKGIETTAWHGGDERSDDSIATLCLSSKECCDMLQVGQKVCMHECLTYSQFFRVLVCQMQWGSFTVGCLSKWRQYWWQKRGRIGMSKNQAFCLELDIVEWGRDQSERWIIKEILF